MIDEDELLTIAITNIRKVLNFDPYKSYSDIVKSIAFSCHHLGIAVDIAAYTLGAKYI